MEKEEDENKSDEGRVGQKKTDEEKKKKRVNGFTGQNSPLCVPLCVCICLGRSHGIRVTPQLEAMYAADRGS